MNNILLLTTSTAEGMPIEKYYGIVTANQVISPNLFNDFIASFSDLFGGTSGAYRKTMNKLYESVTNQINAEASELGANAVVGIKMDFDNISSKNMSMFMVSIQGTAVYLKIPENKKSLLQDSTVLWKNLNHEYIKKQIINKVSSNENEGLTEDEMNFLCWNKVDDLQEVLFEYYKKCKEQVNKTAYGYQPPIWALEGTKNYIKYLSCLDYSDAIKYVYSNREDFANAIKLYQLFSAKHILEIAKDGDLDYAISLLSTNKASYSEADLVEMEELNEYLQNLPDKWNYEESKKGLFTKSRLRYLCACGEEIEEETVYCPSCSRNIKGITADQKKMIDDYSVLVDVLRGILRK